MRDRDVQRELEAVLRGMPWGRKEERTALEVAILHYRVAAQAPGAAPWIGLSGLAIALVAAWLVDYRLGLVVSGALLLFIGLCLEVKAKEQADG